MQTKVNEFFATHPDVTEVHAALGVLFTDKEKAASYLGGVIGKQVETFARPGEPVTPISGTENNEEANKPSSTVIEETASSIIQEAEIPAEVLSPDQLKEANDKMLAGIKDDKKAPAKAPAKRAADKKK